MTGRVPADHRSRPARGRGPLGVVVRYLSRGVDREKVFDEVCEAGQTTGRYVMMSVLSAAIATLGLLLSSPAVVIGAMLLSPLMGPIILLGFSFRTVDWSGTRRAVQSLGVGLGLSLLVAILLTWASPLKEPTAEILARTRPNLFDLLVAVFSGIAGAYAIVRQRGETVIGVAIATALMPPLATVGFGLGTGSGTIALGALLLFATNLVAIALAAAVVAALYGFRPDYLLAKRGWIGHAAVVSVLLALCVPLTLSLQTIALEGRATVSARRAIGELFGDKARITALTVRHQRDGLKVDGLVATPRFIDGASGILGRRLTARLGAPTRVALDQVVLADPAHFAAAAKTQAAADPVTAAVEELRDAVPFATQSVAYDPTARQGVVILKPGALELSDAMQLEEGLRRRDGLEKTLVIPPLQRLAPVPVVTQKDATPQLGPALASQAWALQRWRAAKVSAGVCRMSRHGRTWAAVDAAVASALKPATVTMRPASTADCRAVHQDGAFLLLELG